MEILFESISLSSEVEVLTHKSKNLISHLLNGLHVFSLHKIWKLISWYSNFKWNTVFICFILFVYFQQNLVCVGGGGMTMTLIHFYIDWSVNSLYFVIKKTTSSCRWFWQEADLQCHWSNICCLLVLPKWSFKGY